MKDRHALAPWIKRFLLQYLPSDRNFAHNTQHSYRDALRLLVTFSGSTLRKRPDELLVEDISADLVKRFLRHIEEVRKCSISTRNQRLAAVHTLATVHRRAQPRTSALVRPRSRCAVQEARAEAYRISGKERNRYTPCCPQTKPNGLERGITLCRCSCTTRVLALAKSPSSRSAICDSTERARRRNRSFSYTGKVTMIRFCPLWGLHSGGTETPSQRTRGYRARISESHWPADDEVRNPRHRHALRSPGWSPLR